MSKRMRWKRVITFIRRPMKQMIMFRKVRIMMVRMIITRLIRIMLRLI